MKKIATNAILVLIVASMIIGIVAAENSVAPPEGAGDGIPDGNQFIQPDTPGKGPAPNCGDEISDGSGF
ncbi:MAG: hypothetical protein IAX21_07475 [Candidatus Bathyarchaeota archaeon]|nr:MAG: hypothetical protein IAX21_07475 [Candidatus Bathyarchaeota archaeon]